MEFDYIVVGGGSSGCVIANRLSATGRSVLLVEAGIDTPPGNVPDDILDANPTRAYFNSRYKWTGLKAKFAYSDNKGAEYEQAKVIGGGSSINAQVANRGGPEDYNEWERLGAKGWGWNEVLPYFRKLEMDLDFDGPYHGQDGPLPIQRVPKTDWSGFISALAKSYEYLGISERPDFNGEFADGYSQVPLTNLNGQRISAARAYLSSDVRGRPNLTILAETTVESLIIETGSAVGIWTHSSRAQRHFRAPTIVLCAGAIHTPAILMRSGIGDPVRLTQLGIPIAAALPGVGKNLQEHPSISVSAYLPKRERMRQSVVGHIQLHARYTSGAAGCPSTDMAISAVAKSAWHPLGKRLGSLQLWVNRSFSTGEISISSSDFRIPPTIEFKWLSDQRDLNRLKDGLKKLIDVMHAPPMHGIALNPFPSAWNSRSKRISTMSKTNFVLTGILALLLDAGPRLRKYLIEKVITKGDTLSKLAADDQGLEKYILQNVTGNWHPTSTCKMGHDNDPLAVTDFRGRVRAVSGLRVADASVMPFCPRANTNIPTIMLAERMADLIIEDHLDDPRCDVDRKRHPGSSDGFAFKAIDKDDVCRRMVDLNDIQR